MKTRLFLILVFCATALLTFGIYLDFQSKKKVVSPFHKITSDAPLSDRYSYISPVQLGVQAWHLGDFAAYQFKTNTDRKRLTFHVAAKPEGTTSNEFWLRVKGLVRLNEVDLEFWRLLSVKSLRSRRDSIEIIFASGAVPFLRPPPFLPYPVLLEPLGEVSVETANGTFKCQHYYAYLQAPDGSTKPLLELWANSSVRPLGIVRARWRDEVLELVETQTQVFSDIPEMLSKTIKVNNSQVPRIASHRQENERHPAKFSEFPSASVCTQCHDGNMGGRHLKLEAFFVLSGAELDLTEALYHTYAAQLTHPHKRLSLQTTSTRGQRWSELRFTWAKGSFSVFVKKHPLRRLVFFLDDVAHQGSILVTPTKGRVILHAIPPFL
ncbi:MAG: hypothetical protein V6Z82_04320 [Flavobacteriales bacterium]